MPCARGCVVPPRGGGSLTAISLGGMVPTGPAIMAPLPAASKHGWLRFDIPYGCRAVFPLAPIIVGDLVSSVSIRRSSGFAPVCERPCTSQFGSGLLKVAHYPQFSPQSGTLGNISGRRTRSTGAASCAPASRWCRISGTAATTCGPYSPPDPTASPHPNNRYGSVHAEFRRRSTHTSAHPDALFGNLIWLAARVPRRMKCPVDGPARPPIAFPSSVSAVLNNQW
jgi:hypothetical protein